MGVDWARMRLRRDVDRERLESLIDQQAIAHQTMWGWQSHACGDYNKVQRDLIENLHEIPTVLLPATFTNYSNFPSGMTNEIVRPTYLIFIFRFASTRLLKIRYFHQYCA